MGKTYGTYIALDAAGNRVSIYDVPPLAERQRLGLKYYCELCGEELIARTGSIMAHHFAHKSRGNCDPWSQEMSEWHRKHQEAFPEDFRENVLDEHGEKHRADVLAPSAGGATVVEFQHSPISFDEFIKRNRFYTAGDRRIWWVFDWRERAFEISRVGGGSSISPDDIETGWVYSVNFERKLVAWTRAADEVEGVKIALELDCGERRLLFVVSEFGYSSATGAFIELGRWRRDIMDEWRSACKVTFDKTAAKEKTETVYGAVGDMIDVPPAPAGYFWTLAKKRYHHDYITLARRSSKLVLAASPKPPEEKPARKADTGKPAKPVPEPVTKTKESLPISPEQKRQWGFSPYDALDACRGYGIHLPQPVPSDAVFHLPANDVAADLIPKPYVVARMHADDSCNQLPCRASIDLMYNGKSQGTISIILFDSSDGTDALKTLYEQAPEISTLAVDVSGYKGRTDRYGGLLRVTDFILGRNIINGPERSTRPYRQWVYNASAARSAVSETA